MKQELLLAVAQEDNKNHASKGFLVALHGGGVIRNLQMCPLGVTMYEETVGIVFCSLTLMAAFKVVSHFLF